MCPATALEELGRLQKASFKGNAPEYTHKQVSSLEAPCRCHTNAKQKSWESFLFRVYSAFIRIKCSSHKRDKASVNASTLLRPTAGDSLLAEGGELYNEAKLRVSRAWQYAAPHAFASKALVVPLWNIDSVPPAPKSTCPLPSKACGPSLIGYSEICLAIHYRASRKVLCCTKSTESGRPKESCITAP